MPNSSAPSQPVIPQPPVMPGPITGDPDPKGNENKMIFWLIGGLVVILLLVGGIYWYFSKQIAPTSSIETPVQPLTQKQENLEEEMNAIQIDDIEAAFVEVDKDLQNL